MLIRIVKEYLAAHKRLVVPQLGAFLVKEPERCVVFTELLKRDDGVLRSLLAAAGQSELEAAGEIDRFAFEVRHAVQRGEEYRLEGFGVMRPGPNGTIAFAYDPQPTPDASGSRTESDREGRSAPAEKAPENAPQQTSDTPQKEAPDGRIPYTEPKISISPKMNPEPYVKGLRYEKPRKSTDAYRYVDRPRRKRVDRFVVVAIIAAIVAVAAIAFGYWRSERERRAEAAAIEQPATTQPAAEPAPEATDLPQATAAETTLPQNQTDK